MKVGRWEGGKVGRLKVKGVPVCFRHVKLKVGRWEGGKVGRLKVGRWEG